MDMSTSYLGLKLKNPLVPSASPLSRDLSTLKQLEDAGAAAVVLYSLFEEEITLKNELLNEHLTQGTESFAEALSYFPEAGAYRTGPDAYLEHIRQSKEALAIPLIASLNGVSTGGWIKYAEQIEQAGADALELNVYYLATDPATSGQDVENMYSQLVRDVSSSVDIPVAVKLNPFFSSIPFAVNQMAEAGAAGAVLFNRFYQPDIDIENLEVTPNLVLSDSSELRLPLRWISILYGRVDLDLALTTGVHSGEDAIKGIMAGASVTMMTSELLANGVRRLGQILTEMSLWMSEREYKSIEQMRGSMSQIKTAEPAAFERANYMRVLGSYSPAHN